MKQSTKRIVSSLLALAFLVAALVVFFAYIVPLYKNVSDTKGEAESERALLENQKEIVSQVKDLISAYQEGSQVGDIVSAALPLNPMVAEALMQLSGIAQTNNLVVRNFSITQNSVSQKAVQSGNSATSLLKNTNSFTIRSDFSGSYEDFKNFLRNIESNIRIFDVKNVSIQQAEKQSQNVFLYSVTLTTYYQNQ